MLSRKIRLALAALAVAIGVTSLGPAASADAASLTAKLSLTKNQTSYHSVSVKGVVKATPAEVQQYVDKDYRVVFRLWGSDTFFDDFLFGPSAASVQATPQGLEFNGPAVVKTSILNEDWGTDEVYAGVKLVKSTSIVDGKLKDGPTVVSGKSNEIWRSF
jgi:hypothetical protein